MCDKSVLLTALNIHRVVTRIAHEIAERNDNSRAIALVGVQRGGVHLADRLASLLQGIVGHAVPVGRLDANMHRDDLAQNAAPALNPTVIPFDVTDKTVVLVDDVLSSGRTTRAAMDALIDLGRPASIQLAVLIDRGHRELPIKADFVGKNVPTARDDRVEARFKEEDGEDVVFLVKA
jgi:pyrimidine operon attenuation protein / uracil phosphoribosyltransferase